MSELQNIKTAIHEIAHATLHDTAIDAPERPDRRTREVQAESIAFTVCQHYGLDTYYSFGYFARWSSGRELAELKSSLEIINCTAAKLIEAIDGHFETKRNRQKDIFSQPLKQTGPPVPIAFENKRTQAETRSEALQETSTGGQAAPFLSTKPPPAAQRI
nr:ImmA/IrrE family metallo-endopeptidase [Sporofaciens musculi]